MQLHTISNYNELRLNTLRAYEGNLPYAYVDTEGIATIGIGLNLREHGRLLLQALGFDLDGTQLTGAALQAETNNLTGYIHQFLVLFNQSYSPNNTTSNQALAQLNNLLRQRAINPVYANQQNFVSVEAYTAFHNTQSFLNQTFFLPSPSTTVSENLFNMSLDGYIEPGTGDRKEGYEELLDTWLNRTGVGGIQPGLRDHNNKERLALLSLAFNSKTFGKDQTNTPWIDAGLPTLLGPKLTNALIYDNRAEAWYEIRYGSNAAGIHGDRRYKEANLFGLYNTDPANVTEAEAKEIMRMFTRYEVENLSGTRLKTYENTYRPPASIKDISDSIKPASDLLIAQFAMGNTIDGSVIVGKGLDSYNYIEKGYWNDNNLEAGYDAVHNDLIFGEKGNDELYGFAGNDVIYGGEGNDILIGGIGNDTLIGGENNDTYIINAADGNDTIEDKEGDNTVIICGKEIKFFYDTGDGETYKSYDGGKTLEKSTGTLTDGLNSIIVTLNENFEEGDFGITLIDLPDDISELPEPEIADTIVGDLAPVDMDPEQEGIQYGYDQWGNVIVDPSQSSPDREDYLYDTSGNDKIIGGGGDDQVVSSYGGANWILGGNGCDIRREPGLI